MQTTYHIKPNQFNYSFFQSLKELIKNEKELTITISSETDQQIMANKEAEQERLFKSSIGNWQGDETGDELVQLIYSARVSSTRDIEL